MNAIELRQDADLGVMKELADAMLKSGFFPDAKSVGAAMVKVMAGREIGLGPVESMRSLNIVKGRLDLSADLLAQRVKQHPAYDYRVIELDNTHCIIDFFQGSEMVGRSSFDDEDRKLAGLELEEDGPNGKYMTPWAKYPRNMYFARAMSNGVGWFCPDVVASLPLPGSFVDGSGNDAPVDPSTITVGSGDPTEAAASSTSFTDESTALSGTGEAATDAGGVATPPSADRSGGDGADATVATAASASPPEPHEHIAGPQRLASGKALCIFELPTGLTCGVPFKPAPTVHTAPIDETEERKDIA